MSLRSPILATTLLVAFFVSPTNAYISAIPTGAGQSSPIDAYNFAVSQAWSSFAEYGIYDLSLATEFGEIPILWAVSGTRAGYFLFPDTLSALRSFDHTTGADYSSSAYPKSFSISIPGPGSIAILRGSVLDMNGVSCTWEYPYFREFFERMDIPANACTTIVDSMLILLPWRTRLLIIPAFEFSVDSPTVYMDETAARFPDVGNAIRNFLAGGGTVYAEGNGGYLLEAYGILPRGSVDVADYLEGTVAGFCDVDVVNPDHPLAFDIPSPGIYTVLGPTFRIPTMEPILTVASSFDPDDIGKTIAGQVSGTSAHGGRILLVAGMPAVGMLTTSDRRQWQWCANAILSAFSEKAMNVRSVFTDADIDSADIAPIALPINQSDTFDVTIRVRNLWDIPINNISVVEIVAGFFQYVSTDIGPTPTIAGANITYNIGTIPAGGEVIIRYRLRTPPMGDAMWNNLYNYIDYYGWALVSASVMYFDDPLDGVRRWTFRNSIKVRFLFEADIVADADLNWKNILGEYFQPFKIWSIFENKGRTSGIHTKYVQYIPLDVPIYWVDPMSIPIIRTPGGKFVDLLRGWYDENANGLVDPSEIYADMNGDGNPDAWLDVLTMHPSPDSMVYEEIYWFNPWSNSFEDIDGDGIVAIDIDDDGIFEVEDPHDKIRALRCVWRHGLNPFRGYQWFDPYANWELWIDPPPLVGMAIGAALFLDSLIVDPDTIPVISDNPANRPYYYANWRNWMEFDSASGEIVWKRLVFVHFGSYEGFVFIDDGVIVPDPRAIEIGRVPYPRREYIAVLNLGGHEPTMTSPFCDSSRYSWIEYSTIWGKPKKTPIRVSYTYYTPLPNPLQFEYISCAFEITDPNTGARMQYLPKDGTANLTFNLCASTEYSKYWLKFVGQDWGEFIFNYDGIGRGWTQISRTPDGSGDGVVGYIIHEIPKGIGGYAIVLPRTGTGAIDISALVEGFYPYMDHGSVGSEIVVYELPFKWQILIPQILIPPALDDDDFDRIDDWDDDFGDRFKSATGYLYDIFPPLSGYQAEDSFAISPWDTSVIIEGDLSRAHRGWSPGRDNTYGDDLCEHLGETRLKVRVKYIGWGLEGPVEINKGVWLVNEEIFGGSPWVQWSHAQFAYAKGHGLSVGRSVTPTVVPIHPDTAIMMWRIAEWDEPKYFDYWFDPYLDGTGYGDITIITHVGGSEPASLLSPDKSWGARIDPIYESATVTAIPWAPAGSALDSAGYPKTANGSFLQVIVEVDNTSGRHWYNTTVTPNISSLMGTYPFLWYGCYPRPFVPQHVIFDSTGRPTVLPGDDPRTFSAGWRFNPSASEILFAVGNPDGSITIPEIQASRRGYFIFHFRLDPNLPVAVHTIPFTITANAMDYWETPPGTPVTAEVPDAKFAIVRRNPTTGQIAVSPHFLSAQANLDALSTYMKSYVRIANPLDDVRWGLSQPTMTNWHALSPVSASVVDSLLSMTIPSAMANPWPPSIYINNFWIGAKAIVHPVSANDDLPLDYGATLSYNDFMGIPRSVSTSPIYVTARGALMRLSKRVSMVNGVPVGSDGYYYLDQGRNDLTIEMIALNVGNDIAYNIAIEGVVGDDAEFLSADNTYPYTYNSATKTVRWDNFAHIPPGMERRIPVNIRVQRTEGENLLRLFYAFAVEFLDSLQSGGTTRPVRYRPENPDTIYYGLDLFFADGDLSSSLRNPAIGDNVTLSAKVRIEGNVEAKNVVVRFFDGVQQIGTDKVIASLHPSDSFAVVTTQFTMTKSYHTIFATVDPDKMIGELRENNNTARLELFDGKGDPIKNVVNFPNPFRDYTEFTYVLTVPMTDVKVKVFTVRGRQIKVFDLCPNSLGYNAFGWDGRDKEGDQIANGTYIYKIEGKDTKGERHEVVERIVRMR